MLVTNHVLAGALIGRAVSRRPVAAFAAGVVSHFAMDACPHWGTGGEGGFTEEFVRIARCDGCAGLAAMAVSCGFSPGGSRLAVLSAMVGAAFPDTDKVMLYFFGFDPFPRWWRRFHKAVQNEKLDRFPLEVLTAVGLTAALVAVTRR